MLRWCIDETPCCGFDRFFFLGVRGPQTVCKQADVSMKSRRSKQASQTPKRITDRFEIVSGALGPVPECSLDIRPFTVFIGAQGTGKSLISQVLYSFEELPFLMYLAGTERGMSRKRCEEQYRWILDRLRSSERRFGTFANPNVHLKWSRSAAFEGLKETPKTLALRAYSATRGVTVDASTRDFLDFLRRDAAKEGALHHAIFFPTERMVVSQLRSAAGARVLPLPITYTLFSHWMDDHAAPASAAWEGALPDTPGGREVDRLGLEALRGRARKYGDQWKWQYGRGKKRGQFDLDMASSGQRANWSIPYISRTLFSMRSTGDVADELTLFVEEPEIHLHPAAQRIMVEILALLVHHGFRVVVTTHSLVVLYALNNLIQASRIPSAETSSRSQKDGVPAPRLRLPAESVSVYAFEEDAAPRQLVNTKAAFIDETELGAVSEDLAMELNRIAARIEAEG